MTPKTKRALVPKLRFPEFRDAGEWEIAQLEDLISTITPPKKIPTTDYLSEGSFPIIDQGKSDIAGWTNDIASIVEESQPLIVFGDHTCALKLVRRSFAQGADGIKIIKGSGLADTAFLFQFLCFRPVVSEEYKRHFSILKTKIVAYPYRKSGEQQKIADCLSSVDELITLEARKIDALKAHKKGLMQQLFPAEGETLPKLRFPEFRDAGEWEQGKICDLFKYDEKPEKANEFDSEKIITVKLHANGVVKNERTGTLTGGTNYFKRRANEFIFSKIDLLNGAFGLVPDDLDGFYSSSDVPAFVFKEDGIPFFFLNWLKANYQKLRIERTGTSSTLKRVAPSKFLDLSICLPCKAEQQKIADCLSSIDDLIALEAQKLDALKAHKKGLLQQLFPSLEEARE